MACAFSRNEVRRRCDFGCRCSHDAAGRQELCGPKKMLPFRAVYFRRLAGRGEIHRIVLCRDPAGEREDGLHLGKFRGDDSDRVGLRLDDRRRPPSALNRLESVFGKGVWPMSAAAATRALLPKVAGFRRAFSLRTCANCRKLRPPQARSSGPPGRRTQRPRIAEIRDGSQTNPFRLDLFDHGTDILHAAQSAWRQVARESCADENVSLSGLSASGVRGVAAQNGSGS